MQKLLLSLYFPLHCRLVHNSRQNCQVRCLSPATKLSNCVKSARHCLPRSPPLAANSVICVLFETVSYTVQMNKRKDVCRRARSILTTVATTVRFQSRETRRLLQTYDECG